MITNEKSGLPDGWRWLAYGVRETAGYLFQATNGAVTVSRRSERYYADAGAGVRDAAWLQFYASDNARLRELIRSLSLERPSRQE